MKKRIVLLIFQILVYVLLTIWAWNVTFESLLKATVGLSVYLFVMSCWRFGK